MLPTRHWEAFREGAEDLRYLVTLESLIAKHRDSPEARAAQQWLDQLRRQVSPTPEMLAPIEKESPVLVYQAGKYDGPDYRRFRRQAAEHILSLSAKRH